MQENDTALDEVELRIINAVQYAPRASWSRLGSALGLDAVTVARRWERLTEAGRAWSTVSPGARLLEQICAAFVEVRCAPGRSVATAQALSGDPHAVTIEHITGEYDLLLTVGTEDLAAMSRYVLERVAALPAVTAVRTRLVTRFFVEGGRWRLDALAPAERCGLQSGSPDGWVEQPELVLSLDDRALLRLLAADARAPYRALAGALDVSAVTVRRRLDRLLRLRVAVLRCDFARPLAGWPVPVTFWGQVAPDQLTAVGQALTARPEIRNCAAVSGPENLLLQVWLHSVADIPRIEACLTREHPQLRITARLVTLRQDKLLGRLLDRFGCSTGSVSPNIWADPGAPANADGEVTERGSHRGAL